MSPAFRGARNSGALFPNPVLESACQSDRRQLTPTGPVFSRFCSNQLRSACGTCWGCVHGFGAGNTGQPAGVEGFGVGVRKARVPAARLRRLPKPAFMLCHALDWVPRQSRIGACCDDIAPRVPRAWSNPLAAVVARCKADRRARARARAQGAFPGLCDGVQKHPGERRMSQSRITIGVNGCGCQRLRSVRLRAAPASVSDAGPGALLGSFATPPSASSRRH